MKKISSLYIISFLISTISGFLPAQTFWQESNGINIGRPRIFFTSESGFIIAGSDIGAFRTITNGDYWEETDLNKAIDCFTADVTGNIYAGTGSGGIFFSNNDGKNWIERNENLPEGRVIAITACPNGDVYTVLSKGIYKLTAQTTNWILVDTTMIDSNLVYISSNSEGYLLASAYRGITYMSTNEGFTWTRTDSINQNSFIFSQFIDKNDNLYKSLYGIGTLSSTDNGLNWIKVNDNILVSFSETSSGNFYAISSFDALSTFGVYKSTDNGQTWNISPGTPTNQLAALGALNNGVVLVTGLNGEIFRSSDYGENFSSKRTRPNTIETLAIRKDNTIFAGSFALGIYKSTDGGNMWTQVDNGIIKGGLNTIVIAPNQDVFVASQGGVYKSEDNGETWIESDSGLTKKWAQDITVNSKGDIFVGTFGVGVFRSTDHGVSWQQCGAGISDTNIMKVVVGKDDYLFAGCSVGGAFRSTDNGDSWQFLETGPYQYASIKGIAADTKGSIFVISDRLYYSYDNGDNWATSNFSFDNTLWEIACDNNEHLFVSTYFRSVYRSDDFGVTWNEFSSGLPSSTNVSSFAASEAGYIYAGTINGVYRTINPVTSIDDKNLKTELSFKLLQNYPNPFNPVTKINWQTPVSSWQTLKIYDVLGREIETLLNEFKQAGSYEVEFNAAELGVEYIIID